MVLQRLLSVQRVVLQSRQGVILAPSCRRSFSAYEGKAVADEELIRESDDWAVEETNFNLGRFPKILYFPETNDMSRRVLQILDNQKTRMFTRLRDGTVIPMTSSAIYGIVDIPQSVFNGFEKPIVKCTWDETYDDAWEEEEPEFEEGDLPPLPEEETSDPLFTEKDLMKKASSAR